MTAASDPPTADDVEAAAARLAGVATRTPLLPSPALDAAIGGRLLVKAEGLQRTGSFKFRGAFNRLSALSADERRAGVVAYSSGNHAQGVAAAAGLLATPALIVMPSDAPRSKIDGTRALGAEVVLYDRAGEDREAIAADLAARRGAVLVRPFDDPLVIAGQGTVGLELAEQAEALGRALDAVLVPCSGGGLAAGIALALERRSPRTAVWTVEPAGFDDTARSLAAGRRLANAPGGATACDALMVPMPGAVTFAVNGRRLAGGLAVDDGAVADAMRTAFRILKLVVEPSGAVALAAVLSGAFEGRGRTVAVVCSGANVDAAAFAEVIAGPGGPA